MTYSSSILTSVKNILEDQLRRLVIERRDAREELKQTHAQGPPVHHELWVLEEKQYLEVMQY